MNLYGYGTWKVASLRETSKRGKQNKFLIETINKLSGCNLQPATDVCHRLCGDGSATNATR